MILHGFPILLQVPAVDWPRPQRAACWERRRHPVAFGIVDTMRINPNGLYMLSIAAYRVPRIVGIGGLLVSQRARSVKVILFKRHITLLLRFLIMTIYFVCYLFNHPVFPMVKNGIELLITQSTKVAG